jgi:hypothetical protein
MKRLKAGQPITVVLLSKTYRARTLRGGKGRVYFRLVDVLVGEPAHNFGVGPDPYRATADPGTEGIAWARGWDTHAARALKSATALL